MLISTFLFLSITLYLSLASVGHRFFIHQFYVKKLLQLFEYGSKRVQTVQKRLHATRERRRKLSIIRENKPQMIIDSDDEDIDMADVNDDNDEEVKDDRPQEPENNSGSEEDVDKMPRRTRTASLHLGNEKHDLNFASIMDFIQPAINAIIDDDVTKRFDAKELQTWNLLTRTDTLYHYKSLRLAFIWLSGFIFRYFIMFPIRLWITSIGLFWLFTSTAAVGLVPEGALKRWLYSRVSIMCFRILSRGFSGVITYHNTENKPHGGSICVANHTSPIDVVILHCHNAYALVGQKHGGMLGLLQRALSRATHHIWFDRFEMSDRLAVSNRLREHAENKKKLPILIFPEGTCINNSAVMMFKKGSFEIGAKVFPVAVKYDARFGDPFWNSSKYGYAKYLLMMMTSWAIVCDVYYLPPMQREKDETAIEFASRVKSEIALKGGLVDLEWDGQLKRQKVRPEWIHQQQLHFSQAISQEDDNGIL